MTAAPDRTVPSRPDGLVGRVAAMFEVLAAFALVHVSYRAFKHFTPLGRLEAGSGLNFSAGATMIVFTVGLLLLCKRDFRDYGLTLQDWRSHLNLGVLWGVLLIVAAGAVVLLSPIHADPLHAPDLPRALAAGLGGVTAALLLLLYLRRRRPWLERVPPQAGLCILVGLLASPLVVAASCQRSLLDALLSVLWLFFGAGFGEEIFFRGYVQSRIDQAFGRPFRFLGMEFGPGLFVSSLLFGFIHALNTVDYFAGRFAFAWLWMVSNFCAGLFFGCMREKTKSILPGAIVHGLDDVLAQIAVLLPK